MEEEKKKEQENPTTIQAMIKVALLQRKEKEIWKEIQQWENAAKQILLAITKKLESKFGFSADINVTTRENTVSIMGLYPKWYYFNRPTNMAFHNLTDMAKTSSIPVQQIKSLLSLGLKYCPTPRYTTEKNSSGTQHSRNSEETC
eukprot:13864420-Ditylum_brightwellii.AAC.1